MDINRGYLHERIAYVLGGQGQLQVAIGHSRAGLRSLEKLMEKDPTRGVRYVLRIYSTYLPLLGRAKDRATLAAASARLPALVELTRSKKIHDRLAIAGGPLALAAAGEAYDHLGERESACAWYRKSFDRWEELLEAGFAGGLFDSEPRKVKAHLASCAPAR
jgi:hypothetical protein